jgi:apolipoprotein N-acyltransferase
MIAPSFYLPTQTINLPFMNQTTRFCVRLPPWLVSGVLLGLAWPQFGFETGFLAWFALVPILLRIRRVTSFREHLRETLPAFLIYPVVLAWWLSYYSVWAVPVMLATQSMLLWVPVALLYPLQKRFGWRRALWLLPFVWTIWEWGWLNVSDFNLAVGNVVYTQCRLLWMNQFVDLTGQWGLLCWLIGLNVGIALTLDTGSTQTTAQLARRLALVMVAWLVGPVLYSLAVVQVPSLVVKPGLPPVRVGLIQTNEDSYAPQTDSSRTKVLQRLVALGTKAAQPRREARTGVPAPPDRPRPDLIVAPEGAFPLPLLRDSALFAGLRQYVQYYDTPFATGLMTPIDSGHYYNEAFVFTPELSRVYEPLQVRPEDLQVYRKQHSLVFGEHSPWFLRWANRWLRPGLASVTLGNAPYAFTFTDRKQNPRKLAIAICWEQLYPATIASLVRENPERGPAEFLAFIMNDGWFYDSPGPRILLAFTQLRAIENRRSVARCSNQGYTGYVDPFGRVVSVLPRQTEAVADIQVMANTQLTFFTRHPNWFPILSGLLVLIGLFRLLRSQKQVSKASTKSSVTFNSPNFL